MNHKLLFTLSASLLFVPALAPAQGTAFTYQGLLLNGGQPAAGAYDLQFRLTDAATEGNGIGPTLTQAPVLVSNGLFQTTLDFGAGGFNGSARWLEIAVRTNGSAAPRTVLSPRQPITAAPYATYAQTAASATVAASLAGANIIAGNGAGVTNLNGAGIQAGTLSSNQFDAATWQLLTNQVNEGSCNLNRWSWQNTMAKLAARAPIQLMTMGDSMSSAAQFYGPLFLAVKDAYGFDGGVGCGGFNLFNPTPTPPAYLTNDWSTWYTWFCVVPSGGIYTWTSLGYKSVTGNVLEVDYVAEAGAGAFELQTNINNTTWQDVPGFASVSADNGGSPTGMVIRFTNALAAPFQMRAIGRSGTVRILGGAIMDFTKPGVILNDFAVNSSGMGTFLNLPEAITGPVMRSWAPDLIFWKWWDGPDGMAISLPPFRDYLAKYLPNTDIVFVGENPVEGAADASIAIPQNAVTRSFCQQYGWAYFDGYSIFGSFTNGLAHGLLRPNYDVHLTAAGNAFEADALLNWLGLLDNATLGFWNAPGLQQPQAWTGGDFAATGNLDVTGYIAVHGSTSSFACMGHDGTGNMQLYSPTSGKLTFLDWGNHTELLTILNDLGVATILPYQAGNLGRQGQPWWNVFATNGTFYGTVNATRGFAAGSAAGLTTNLSVVLSNGTTNQLQFTAGILTAVLPK